MKDGFLHYAPALEMLDDDSLEQLRRNVAIPDPFRVYDNYRAPFAHPKARSLASLHPAWTEQQILALKQRREKGVERAPTPIR